MRILPGFLNKSAPFDARASAEGQAREAQFAIMGKRMTKPLSGIRVIEIGNIIAGPLCGTLLADMGADVIKIEPLKGDMSRAIPPHINGESVSFAALNRNKRSLCLDMRTLEGQDIVRRLAQDTDVFLENNRPGVMEKLGLDGPRVKASNPGIVYISVSGYGQTGPFRSRGVVNLIAEAASGMLSVSGETGKMPMRPGIQSADLFGALFATYAVLSSLVGRVRHGEGRIADVSLIESSVAAAAWEAAGYLATGEIPGRSATAIASMRPIRYSAPRTAATSPSGAPNDGLFLKLLEALNLSEHAKDERFSSYSKRKQNEAAIVAIVEAAYRRMGGRATRSRVDRGGRAVLDRQELQGSVREPQSGLPQYPGHHRSPQTGRDEGGSQSGAVRCRRPGTAHPGAASWASTPPKSCGNMAMRTNASPLSRPPASSCRMPSFRAQGQSGRPRTVIA